MGLGGLSRAGAAPAAPQGFSVPAANTDYPSHGCHPCLCEGSAGGKGSCGAEVDVPTGLTQALDLCRVLDLETSTFSP